MTRWTVNNKLERAWKEVVIIRFKVPYNVWNHQGKPRKTLPGLKQLWTKNFYPQDQVNMKHGCQLTNHDISFILHVLWATFGTLTFKWPGGYLNFCAQFVKNVLLEKKRIKLWNKQHFVENKTQIMQRYVLTIQ